MPNTQGIKTFRPLLKVSVHASLNYSLSFKGDKGYDPKRSFQGNRVRRAEMKVKHKLETALGVAFLALLWQLLYPGLYDWSRLPSAGSVGVGRINGKPLQSVRNEYLLYLPAEYASSWRTQQAFPLVIFLHGSGERGDNLEKVRCRSLPKHLCEGHSYPTIVVAPQCREKAHWRAEDLALLIDQIEERFNVDKNRVIVMGESMGGFGAWDLAAYAPQRLAAVVPLCGGGEVSTTDQLKGLSIWAFHGDKDGIVPLEGNQKMVEAALASGAEAKLTVLQDTGHDLGHIPLRTDLMQWITEQHLSVE